MKTLYIDGDACNAKSRAMAIKFCEKNNCSLVLVSDRKINIESNLSTITNIVVPSADNSADNYILQHIHGDDALITRDLELAKLALEKKACVTSDNGEVYTSDIIDARILRSKAQAQIRNLAVYKNNRKGSSLSSKKEKSRLNRLAFFLQKWL